MPVHARVSALATAIALAACGGSASGADAGSAADASSAADAASPDAGPEGCPAGQHDCDGVCTSDGLNDPATGCRLGCGAPCPAGTEALCTAEGACGRRECAPRRCEDVGATCGLVEDGCGGRLSCGTCDAANGQRCEANACACTPDPNEPNESRAGLTSLATLNDFDDPPPFPLDGTLHHAGDEDWYQLTIIDGGAGGNPLIRVELEATPAGSDYVVAAYFDCASASLANNETSCTEGAVDNLVERGCTSAGRAVDRVILATECAWTTDESGTLWVRVYATTWAGTCGGYTVRVTVT
jgi:hypothetical protein